METQEHTSQASGRPFSRIIRFLYEHLSLREDKENEQEIVDAVSRNVVFRGVNLWTLVFAIFIASIGLNVDSTAVVIGAMLISPLMGPIIGVGMGVAVNDFDLIKKAAYNLGIAVVASVVTSSLYFALTPLSDAGSELLARTSPTIWDVLIAFFGGMAGIVAGTSKEKGNVIPGVAIATALMPPLCTAGYGLATWNLTYFFGAFYLFFINSVMISLSTFLVVRLLNFPRKGLVDEAKDRLLRRVVWSVVALTVLPSIYLGYLIVVETIYNRNVSQFIKSEMNWENTQVVTERHEFAFQDTTVLEVLLTGEPIEESEIARIRKKMPEFGLHNTQLVVRQGLRSPKVDVDQIRSQVIKDLYLRNQEVLEQQEGRVRFLEEQLSLQLKQQLPVDEIAGELCAIYPNVKGLHLGRATGFRFPEQKQDTIGVVLLTVKGSLSSGDQKRIEAWLVERTDLKKVKVVVER